MESFDRIFKYMIVSLIKLFKKLIQPQVSLQILLQILVSLQLNQYIYIIEVHPFKDNIAFTADYNGDVVIWDIIAGRILNIFNELGTHLLYPNLEVLFEQFSSKLLQLPIIDGRFSPSGYSFALSTYYGSFSIYGYGCPDPYLYTPVQQFFENDFKKFEVDESLNVIDSETKVETYKQKLGALCRYNHQPYEYQFYSQEHKFSESNLYQDYTYFLKLAKENRKQNKYFEEQLNSAIQMNLETIQKQHIIFCQMRDFEKCMFLGINFNEAFLALEQFFKNKEEFNVKLQRFNRSLTALSSDHNQLVLKKYFIPSIIQQSTTTLTSILNQKHLSIPTVLSFFNKITEENAHDDSLGFKTNSLNQSKRRGRLSKTQAAEKQKVQVKPEEDIIVDYDDPEDLNYEISDKSQVGGLVEEEENEKVPYPEEEKPNLRQHRHYTKSKRKILTRSQAAASKSKLNYSEMVYSNEDDSFDGYKSKQNRYPRRRFRIVGDSESEMSQSEDSVGRKKRYEMRKRKKIHFNEDGEIERDKDEIEEDEISLNRKKQKNKYRKQRLNSSESENQMEVEENLLINKQDDDSLFNIEEEEQKKQNNEPISETSQQKGHKLQRLAKGGAGRRNYQYTNTPNYHSRILLRNALPDYMHQQVTQHTKTQQLDQCSRCNYDNASVKCCISWCGKQFHEQCAELRGVIQPNTGKFYCHGCFFLQNTWSIINQLQNQAMRNNRKKSEKICQYFLDEQEMLMYEPQVGDIVYYLFEAHELFISRYFWYIDLKLLFKSVSDDDENTTEILPFLLHSKLLKCGKTIEPLKVISVNYDFSPSNKTLILTNVGLQLVSDPTFKFTVQYAHFDLDSSFLILASVYNYYVNSILPHIEQFDNVEALTQSQEEPNWSISPRNIQIMKIESQDQAFPDSKWQNLLVRSIDSEGYALRNSNQQQFRINCWQLTSFSKAKAGQAIKPPQAIIGDPCTAEFNSILELIEKYIEENEELCKEFAEPIDMNFYSNYFDVVPLEMPLSKIKTRIKNNYYRRIEALLADFDQLLFNAETYLTKGNQYYKYAEQIVKELKGKIKKSDINVIENFEIEPEIIVEEKKQIQLQQEPQVLKQLEDFEIIIDETIPIKDRNIMWLIHNKSKYCIPKSVVQPKKFQIQEAIDTTYTPRPLRSLRRTNTVQQQIEKEEIAQSEKYKLRNRAKKLNYAE